MKSIWLFRSNLRILEEYHKIHCKTIEEFEKACHDFWLLQLIEFLKQDHFDEAIVFRLKPNKDYEGYQSFSFKINDKTKFFYQIFVDKFTDIFSASNNFVKYTPQISFFRGGFPEYDKLIIKHGDKLGLKLYCGTGQRVYPKYGGKYDFILLEDEKDDSRLYNCINFYKTTSPNHFYMNDREPKYDICFVANFTQYRYKGQEFFIKAVSKSPYLKTLDILMIGNKQEMGEKLCKKYKVTNIKFLGYKSRNFINQIINKSKFGIVCSNRTDGCPRVVTEILSCGTPLFIRNTTRLLSYYKRSGVIEFNESNIESQIRHGMENWESYKKAAANNLDRISLKTICKKNINLWKN